MGLFGPSKAELQREAQRRTARHQRTIFANDAAARMVRLEKATLRYEFDDSPSGRRKFWAATNALRKLDCPKEQQRILKQRTKLAERREAERREAERRKASKSKSSWWF